MTELGRRSMLGAMATAVSGPVSFGRVRANEPFRPVGRVSIDGAKEIVVAADGATAYVATTDGFATVDLQDETDPTVLADRRGLRSERDDGPMEAIWDVKVDDQRLLVAGPANPSASVSGFALYDVSDPSTPRELGFYETTYPIHNAYLAGDTAYLTAGEPIVAVDVSGDEFREAGRWTVVDADAGWADVPGGLRTPHDLWVQDGVAYVACWDAGTWIVDVSEPGSPAAVGRVGGLPRDELADLSPAAASRESLEPPGNHHYVQPSTDGSVLAIGKESWSRGEGGGGPGGIDLWDVADPTAPRKLSEIRPPRAADETRGGTWTTSHNFDLAGDRLFSSWYQGGVKIHDVSDPGAPEELAWWHDPEDAAFWAAVQATDEFFVASSTNYPAPGAAEGLYTFPNRPGEQPDPPQLTPSENGTRRSSSGEPRNTRSTARHTQTTRSSEPSDIESPTDPATRANTSGQSGFGLGGAIAGTVVGVWWRCRRNSERDGETK